MVRHDAALRAPRALAEQGGMAVLRSVRQNFVADSLAALVAPGDLRNLKKSIVTNVTQEPVTFYQPVHRAFQLIFVDVACEAFGAPPLDPRQIHSAGVVVRRRLPDPATGALGPLQGWSPAPGRVRWFNIKSLYLEPNPALRPADAHLRRTGRARPGGDIFDEEATSPLFLAPPEVCRALGRTLYYGVIPVTCPPDAPSVGAGMGTQDQLQWQPDELDSMLPGFLRQTPEEADPVPWRGHWLSRSAGRDLHRGGADGDELRARTQYMELLNLLAVAADVLTPSAGVATVTAQQLISALNAVTLPLSGGHSVGLGAHLTRAAAVLVYGEPGAVEMPTAHAWPVPSDRDLHLIRTRLSAVLQQRASAAVSGVGGRQGRFEHERAVYEPYAFVRVRCEAGCPPHIFWSSPGPRFRIAPWYESGPEDAPVHRVLMPELTRDFIKTVRPNVVFRVPKSLFNFLKSNTPGDLLAGEGGQGGDSPSFDWICGFNIPIITICAFIMLVIMLSLLNIVFWWLPFVKICIPLPRSANDSQ